MGPIFNFTTDFNRVTKQDVSDVNFASSKRIDRESFVLFTSFSRGLSWIRDRLSVASRGLQLLPLRDWPSQQADRKDQHHRAALLHGSGCHAFRDLAGSSGFAPIKGRRVHRYLKP